MDGDLYGPAAALYDQLHVGPASPLLVEFFAELAPEGGHALEFGPGTGRVTLAVAERSASVHCLEPSPSMRTVLLTKLAALPHLRASSHASVVNVLSAGVFMPIPFNAMYAAAKTALLSFTRSMAAAWAPDGIRVNGLVPGSTDTDMLRSTSEARRAELAAASMMGRAAQPAEMVGPAVFLASDASSYMTGQVLMADGGLAPH